MSDKIIIKKHPRELHDLQEFFCSLTRQCNSNCAFCIEREVHTGGFINKENFISGVNFAKEHGLNNFFLHGGEPTMHPDIVDFAHIAKNAGLTVKMFTNGKKVEVLKQLDGIVDEFKISYRGSESMQFIQSEWKTKLALEVLVTEKEFPTLNSLLDFLAYARQATGMNVYANTMNPVNQGAYDSQYVSYLEELFLSIPIDDIFCTSNKATFILSDGTRARLGNKSLNPNHMKFSMTPDGVIHDHFERHFEIIEHNSELDEKLALADKRLEQLRKL